VTLIPTLPQPLVLASSSQYRRQVLERLGVSFEVDAPTFDERSIPWQGDARSLVTEIAFGKARSVLAQNPDKYVLGGDQVVHLDGEILGKPGDEVEAVRQLKKLSGRVHELVTATVLVGPMQGDERFATMIHSMTMRHLDENALRSYVQRDRPIDCAGSYRIESLGSALFSTMHGPDHTGIIGLPVTHVISLIESALTP